jgi:hypothetical protein
MTRDELLSRLRELRDESWGPSRGGAGDFERAHSDADDALLGYINDPEVTAIFKASFFMYA